MTCSGRSRPGLFQALRDKAEPRLGKVVGDVGQASSFPYFAFIVCNYLSLVVACTPAILRGDSRRRGTTMLTIEVPFIFDRHPFALCSRSFFQRAIMPMADSTSIAVFRCPLYTNSGHVRCKSKCPLSANSGRQPHICSDENRKTASQRSLRKLHRAY
jgi:hypothetical protein